MKKFILPFISDMLFTALVAFFACFIVVDYFVPRPYSFVYAILFSCLCLLPAVGFSLNKKKNKTLSDSEAAKIEETFSALHLLCDDELSNYFLSVYKAAGESAEKTADGVRLTEKKQVVFFVFSFREATKTDVVRAFNKITANETAVILCEKTADDLLSFSARFNGRVRIKTKAEVYDLIHRANIYPPQKIPFLKNTPEKTRKFSFVPDKRKAKTFFKFGLIFCFMSFFVPYKIYYVVCGAISLVLSLSLKIFGKTTSDAEPA